MQISPCTQKRFHHIMHIIILTVIKVRGAHRSKVAIEYSWPDALANTTAVEALYYKLTLL